MAEKPAVPACESDDAATAGHPTPQTTAETPPAPNPTYVDKPAKDGTEEREAKVEGPGHAT